MRRLFALQAAQPDDERQDTAVLPCGVEGEEREGLVDVVVEVLFEAVLRREGERGRKNGISNPFQR